MTGSLFRDLAPPPAPHELRSRVLTACREASANAKRHWIDRLWESTALRLGWAALTLLLFAIVLAAESTAPKPWIVSFASSRAVPATPATLFGSAAPEHAQTLLIARGATGASLREALD